MIKISVICPTYNSGSFIEKTLKTLIIQTQLPHEVIISDDGSSDNTIKLVEQFILNHKTSISWKVLKNTHKGPGAARNSAIRVANGEWIAFLDSDDLWIKDKIKTVSCAIKNYPNSNFFCHNELFISKSGRTRILEYGQRYHKDRPLLPQIYLANMFSTSAVVCKSELLRSNFYFNETFMSAQDYELWLRLSPIITPIFIKDILGKYVERTNNISTNNLWKRLNNEIRIIFIYKNQVSTFLVILRLFRVFLSYTRQFFKYKLSKENFKIK